MIFYNLKDPKECVSFAQAVKQGLGKQQGLFFPIELPQFSRNEINNLLEMDFIMRSSKILSMYTSNDIPEKILIKLIKQAFLFPINLVKVHNNISCLELFHGPTLSFKDFGASFMAQVLSYLLNEREKITILTATSGDTGSAVAHAFFGMKNIQVIILYPYGKITPLQEQLFCTLGDNIKTIAINANFDVCQMLVKQAFNDKELKRKIYLNSANSINISRLLAQICYYFEAISQLRKKIKKDINECIISVPSGNFGNLTAGLMAKSLGLPIKRFIAATNANDTVPRFLQYHQWSPKPTLSTLSNAMDVSQPNNWPRIQELFFRKHWNINELGYGTVSDTVTRSSMEKLTKIGYTSEPHSAIAYQVLSDHIQKNEYGIFLATAHPVKFKEVVEQVVKTCPLFPTNSFIKYNTLPILSYNLKADFSVLKKFLLDQ